MPATPSYMFGRTSSFSAAPNGPSTPVSQPAPSAPAPNSTTATNYLGPQALSTNYAARLKSFNTALLQPTPQQGFSTLPPRSAKRGQAVINYAEDDDDDFEDRSDVRLGRGGNDLGEDAESRPVEYKGKLAQATRPSFFRTDEQQYEASLLPCTLVPIRLDLDLNTQTRLKDSFLWNLNESLITPDQFAQTLCADLDLPINMYASTIASTIRAQLEENATIATITLPDSIGGDDAEPSYRVVVKLSLYVNRYLYEDKFEWDLLNKNLTPEHFAKICCRDMGLHGEFYPLITNAIYEQVLKLKKELLETGNIHLISGESLDNDAALGSTFGAGWRHDSDGLGFEWGPNVEKLSQEEIEKREGDRERQIRRARRETSRFTTGSNLSANYLFMDLKTPGTPGSSSMGGGDEALGRGERNKRKRNRSGSPASMKPKHHGALASSALGPIGAIQLSEYERSSWKCSHCKLPGTGTWAVRDGPDGQRTLCNICGAVWKDEAQLPSWRLDMYKYDYWPQNR